MTFVDYCIHLLLSVVLIVGGYQFYFWCQRHPLTLAREWNSALDDRIPLFPRWVWIYNCLYYPVILYTNAMVGSPAEFTRLATTYLVLLVVQMGFFVSIPVRTPLRWRAGNASLSEDGSLDIGVPSPHRALVLVHQTALPRRSPRRRCAWVAGVPRLPVYHMIRLRGGAPLSVLLAALGALLVRLMVSGP